MFGDKAYISKKLFHQLLSNGLRLFTNLRKDMQTYLLDIDDKRLLNKRSLIESVFNVLKKHMHLEHTRHCSPINFLVHIISSFHIPLILSGVYNSFFHVGLFLFYLNFLFDSIFSLCISFIHYLPYFHLS
ncbi:transposase DDE domain protein [Orientia tsutsugamushi str. TA763]|nr:transposase DDE domain protein [Orientia tsutsugamushi str. TA763]